MNGYLVDTNVLSELTKPSPLPEVEVFLRKAKNSIFVSVFSIGEVRKGIAGLPMSNKRASLEDWLAPAGRGLRPWSHCVDARPDSRYPKCSGLPGHGRDDFQSVGVIKRDGAGILRGCRMRSRPLLLRVTSAILDAGLRRLRRWRGRGKRRGIGRFQELKSPKD